MEFGRRLAVERELEKTSQASTMNAGIINRVISIE